jgi:nucleotide-binding universal stress UspA family protein
MTHRIVVGVDGSEHGNAALRWAVDEAKVHESEVIAVFAWQLPFVGIPDAVETVVRDTPVPITKLVAEGDVRASLIEAAKNADMLVLGSRGRRGFAALKLGSVSQECVQHVACPVVIIKHI